jgi:hypothetical protein
MAAHLMLLVLAADWSHLDDDEGMSLDGRGVEGSKYLEYRVTTSLERFPIEVACRAAFGDGKPGNAEVKSRKLLKDEPNERIYYDQIESKLVSNRDYVLRQTWRVEGERCLVEWQTVNAMAPPLSDGWVRIEKMYGSIRIEPKGDQAVLTYSIMTDVAGSIPAVFVEGSRKKAAFRETQRTTKRVREAGQKALADAAKAPAPASPPSP